LPILRWACCIQRTENSTTETPEFAKIYEQAGVDAINVTGGWHESRVPQLPMHLPRAAFAFLALNDCGN
jgi:2,4-dienoyl-CoA reductase (NADPH2)